VGRFLRQFCCSIFVVSTFSVHSVNFGQLHWSGMHYAALWLSKDVASILPMLYHESKQCVLDTPAFNVVLHHICSWTNSTTPNVLIAKDPTWFYLRISHLFTDHYNAALTNCFSQITIEHSNSSTWWSIDVLPGHLDNHIVLTAFSSLLWLRRVVNIRAAPVLPKAKRGKAVRLNRIEHVVAVDCSMSEPKSKCCRRLEPCSAIPIKWMDVVRG